MTCRAVAGRLARVVLALALVWSGTVALHAQELPDGLPALEAPGRCTWKLPETLDADARTIVTAMPPKLVGTRSRASSLPARMAQLKVAGVSVAVIRKGELAWAHGFGIADMATCAPVRATTAFQAASISKTFAAVLAMQAVARGDMALDRDINGYLKRWTLPRGSEAPADAHVTLRQLLNHTGAVSIPASGGYRPGTVLPTIVQVVRGELPAKGPPVRIAGAPGTAFAYSNGGYHTVQIAIEDATGAPFAALAQRDIFGPLGMIRSSFAQPPVLAERAAGHHERRPFADKAYWVSELAAGGLWSTPSDLARFLIAVRRAADGETGAILPPERAREMLLAGRENWSLGFEIDGTRFGHGGVFWGMMSRMWIDRESGDGIVVMANDFQGMTLADAIIRSAAARYGWTDLAPRRFAAARDAAPFFLRGTINDWSTATRFERIAAGRYAAELIADKAGAVQLKIASADWKTFVLGAPPGQAVVGKDLRLDPEGEDIQLMLPHPGRYRLVLDAPDTGVATLRADPA